MRTYARAHNYNRTKVQFSAEKKGLILAFTMQV